jgi:UDP-3-O-[3-hydroxymyristoyl] glucosamine N-acyltransferase
MLSILKNAGVGSITYYIGDNPADISHLRDCTLYCEQNFNIHESVNQIIVEDAQLEFYKLSNTVEFPYKFTKNPYGNYEYTKGNDCDIHPTAVIGDGVIIGNNVTIGPNSVIYSKTKIGDGTRIDSNVTIGTEGMMWVWDKDKKIYLRQLGGVKIGENCIIGSNCAIVRGSANEHTILQNNVNMAPGCNIGHGTFIGENSHLANGIKTGGSSYIGVDNFLGSGSILLPGTRLESSDIIIGAGCVVTKSLMESGVYVGNPCRKVKNVEKLMRGIPKWK